MKDLKSKQNTQPQEFEENFGLTSLIMTILNARLCPIYIS